MPRSSFLQLREPETLIPDTCQVNQDINVEVCVLGGKQDDGYTSHDRQPTHHDSKKCGTTSPMECRCDSEKHSTLLNKRTIYLTDVKNRKTHCTAPSTSDSTQSRADSGYSMCKHFRSLQATYSETSETQMFTI